MTKKEAVVIIGNIPIDGKDDCYSIAEYQEAKTMAIEALEQNYVLATTLEVAYKKIKQTMWIPFRQRKNPATGLFEWDEPLPKEGQHILITISMRGHEPVQDDYWYVDGTVCYLDSGYDIGTEAVAWMPLPEPYTGREKGNGRQD